jgi:membrane protein YqaA with SNARE-associated domain
MAVPKYLRIGAAVDYCMRYAETRKALYLLGVLSALESAILPIPIDAVTIPMMVVSRARVWLVALVASVTSVAGGIIGYLIGYLTYESLGVWLIGLYGLEAEFLEIRAEFALDLWTGAAILFLGAVSPIPFKLTCIAAGFMSFNVPLFLAVAVIGRTLRFYAIALVMYWFGPPIKTLLERYKATFTVVVLVVVIAGFVAIKYLV